MKIFYLGMQRCGTKSFGEFFRKNGFRVCSWPEIKANKLNELFFNGQWIEFFKSGILDKYDVFEDGPFYDPMFARFLSNYVPNSKFVYFFRPSDDWYKSMVTHSNGLTLGDLKRHCYLYDRLSEIEFLKSNGIDNIQKFNLVGAREHYTRIYNLHQQRIRAKFDEFPKSRFFSESLYSKDKFINLNQQFDLNLKDTSETHTHKSHISFNDAVSEHKYIFKNFD